MPFHAVFLQVGDDGRLTPSLIPPRPFMVEWPAYPEPVQREEWPNFRRLDIDFDGPPHLPPGPLSDGELIHWLATAHDGRWVERGGVVSELAKPLVSGTVNARVLVRVRVCDDLPEGRTLEAEVENIGVEAIPNVSAWTRTEYETPQPATVRGISTLDVGSSERLHLRSGPADIPPGETTRFLLHPMFLPSLLSRTAALSPERYRLAVRSENIEIGECSGDELSAVLEELE